VADRSRDGVVLTALLDAAGADPGGAALVLLRDAALVGVYLDGDGITSTAVVELA
jgi:hypothetical protein